MNGQPVWLASISRRDASGRLVATGRWSKGLRDASVAILRDVVHGVGDPTRERLFRMNITLCMHRALTDEEVAGLPKSWHAAAPMDIAGGPVEVLRESTPGALSTQPCKKPGKRVIMMKQPELWLPIDCGKCPPCKARAAIPSYCGA